MAFTPLNALNAFIAVARRRSQVSPALRAFVDVAREVAGAARQRAG